MKQNWVASQDPRSYSLYFGLNIWFRARKATATSEKQAPGVLRQRKMITSPSDKYRNLIESPVRNILGDMIGLIWKTEQTSGKFPAMPLQGWRNSNALFK